VYLQGQKEKEKINGLILIGGRSSRMGNDKSLLSYHNGLSQREYLYKTISKYCSKTFFSLRNEQAESIIQPKIIDLYEMGPIGGILSAFEYDSDSAWLVVACDMPFVNEFIIENLLANRNKNKAATAFFNVVNNAPEPLLTIYEPLIFDALKKHLQDGHKSPLKLLQKTDIQLLNLENQDFLKNSNTPTDYEVMSKITVN
jgi:molybdenum cofactor guanylyltransferase